MKTLLLDQDDIREVARQVGLNRLMDEAIMGLQRALFDFDSAQIHTPSRRGFDYKHPAPGLIEWMPTMHVGRSATVKLVGYHPTNPATRCLPTILSTVFEFDVATGHLTTVADATFTTALRTGAASAVASRILAERESQTLGLIGCGAQALTQLHAMVRSFDITRVLIYDIDPSIAASLRRRARVFGFSDSIEVTTTTPKSLLAASDIVCTQTSTPVGRGPVVQDTQTHAHLHVNAVGSDFPGKIELPRTLLERSLVVPDFRQQAVREGECQVLDAQALGPDLHEVVQNADHFANYRGSSTVFDSTGWALEDHVTLELLQKHARRLGLGRLVALEPITQDPTHPYEGMTSEELNTQIQAPTAARGDHAA